MAYEDRGKGIMIAEALKKLAPGTQWNVRDETIEILRNEGVAVLIVTHEPEEAMNMADNIALMRDGKIIQQGAPYNIYNKPTYT